MPEYRVYFIGTDGAFFKAQQILSPDDSGAIEKAKQLVDGHDVELWLGDRKIIKFDSKEE